MSSPSASPSGRSRILVVGGGSIGERHVRCLLRTGRAEVSLCEPDPTRGPEVAERHQVSLCADFTEALQSRPEGVVICTPAPLHVPMAREAVAAGAHVLVEKPLSTSIDGAGELAAEAGAADRRVRVAYVWRRHPAVRAAHEHLHRGSIGELLQIHIAGGQDFAALRQGYATTYYADRAKGGGAIQDGLTHFANLVEMLAGPTSSLLCEADHLAIPGVEVEDSVGVIARHGRVLAVYAYNQTQKPNEMTLELHGTTGSLRVDLTGKRLGLFTGGTWEWTETPYEDHDVLFTSQADAFLDAIHGSSDDLCTLEEGLQTLHFNLACLRSMEEGKKISL